MLDEDTGLAFHALVLINPKGEVIYRETAGEGASVVKETFREF